MPPTALLAARCQAIAAALLLAACAGNGPSPSDGGSNPHTDGTLGPNSAWVDPVAPSCPTATTGVGSVWLDDPADRTMVERPLHCLAGDGRLHGPYVTSVTPDSWEASEAADGRFVYGFDDQHQQEVQAYYTVVGMVGHAEPLVSIATIPALDLRIEAQSSFATSRYRQGPARVIIGLTGIDPAIEPAQLVAHEYAHHLILRHAGGVDQVTNEALADYLAADFSGRPLILSSARVAIPAELRMRAELMELAGRYFDRSVDNAKRYPEDLVTEGELCDLYAQAQASDLGGTALVPQVKLDDCGQLSPGQRQNPQAHRTGLIVAGALWELRAELGSRTVGKLVYAALASNPHLTFLELAQALLTADEQQHGGANQAALRRILSTRGLLAQP